ncbi:GAF domain-containing protein [Mucilaginibacter sp. KACC 22063]|uniref:GAF domain-containing protein n=1 Tax=Mucilaginibacter sp. KACC 22063 TaxID=3025666 RepID=UPI002365BB78|nr:GAF domain-containing protein [Mucilaginibacter sp. KACC 22063]WDF54735.1 PAS domain S-box protein [Mucilaginibacter sp. KACC 22063]
MFKQDPHSLQAIERFLNLNIDKAFELQEITMLTAAMCDVPAAVIGLKNDNNLYATILPGFDFTKEAISTNFCNYAIEHGKLLISNDTLTDKIFKGNRHVSTKDIRFYAGLPLSSHNNPCFGSLYVLDTQPRRLTPAQIHLLKVLAKRIVQIMDFSSSLQIMKAQFSETKSLETKLRSFFESSASCHLLIGKQMEIMAFNKKTYDTVERIYNIKVHSGLKINRILKGEPLSRFMFNCYTALGGKPVKYERRVVYNTGEVAWWHLTAEPFYGPDNLISGVSINATDITERKLSEQQISDKNKILEKIAYIQSHELRRPVASILGFLELFKTNNYQADPEDLQLLQKVTEELDEMIRTIVQSTY